MYSPVQIQGAMAPKMFMMAPRTLCYISTSAWHVKVTRTIISSFPFLCSFHVFISFSSFSLVTFLPILYIFPIVIPLSRLLHPHFFCFSFRFMPLFPSLLFLIFFSHLLCLYILLSFHSQNPRNEVSSHFSHTLRMGC
jgi:hypothetical protein